MSEEPPRKQFRWRSTSLIQFIPDGTIRFTGSSGYLILEGWDRQDVETTVLKFIDHEFVPEQVAAVTERLKAVSVNVEHASPQELVISTARGKEKLLGGKGRLEFQYHIWAPRNSRIAVDHRGGYILLSGMTGDIDIASRSGRHRA